MWTQNAKHLFCFATNLLAARAESCSKVVQKLTESCPKVAPNHNRRNCHENSPRKSCGPLIRTVLTGISVRTFLCRRRFLRLGSIFGARDIKTEIVTKIVPVKAVDLSIGPFCTEFWCERFCDDAVFLDRADFRSISDQPTNWTPLFFFSAPIHEHAAS